LECIADELAAVDRTFQDELASDLACVNTLVKHVSRFRGKMLRPTLLLLTAKALGPIRREHIVLATVVEMVHMATLVHDDVLDDAELRRRGATINHLRGNEAAVMLGDYLISHSYHLCSSLDSQFASRAIAAATNRVCEGELLQIDNRQNLDLDEPTCLQILERKTATLCGTSCRLGAKLSGASETAVNEMEKCGIALGIAFQIQDDILDITGDASTVGKTLGLDVEKGKLTLPIIHFLKHAPIEHQQLMRSLLSDAEPDRAEKIRNLIMPSDSILYAQDRARSFVNEAQRAIAVLPPSRSRDALHELANFIVDRPA
jgi:octaprenyl-diphosphate synthase